MTGSVLAAGCLSVWFRAHPDLLQAVLPVILDGLTNPTLATSAALAFRDVCAECAEQLAPVVMQIIPTCQVHLSLSVRVPVMYHLTFENDSSSNLSRKTCWKHGRLAITTRYN